VFITVAAVSLFGRALLSAFGRAIPALPGPSGYHILKTIPLPGTEGWDYLTMDSASRILYISRENHIDAVNVDTGMIVDKVTGLEGTNGLLPVPELRRGNLDDEPRRPAFPVCCSCIRLRLKGSGIARGPAMNISAPFFKRRVATSAGSMAASIRRVGVPASSAGSVA
jgi:hypothetical protein